MQLIDYMNKDMRKQTNTAQLLENEQEYFVVLMI